MKLPSEALTEDPSLSMLLDAVTSEGLVTDLNDASDITIFAPDNDAFKQIQDVFDDLIRKKNDLTKPANKDMLRKFLLRHVVKGATWTADKLKQEKENGELEMASGETVRISFDTENILQVVFGDTNAVDYAIAKESMLVKNGVIHILTRALGIIICILGKYNKCIKFS